MQAGPSPKIVRTIVAAAIDDPDTDLVAAVARGDQAAARNLVERHLPKMIAVGRRMLGNQADAEEVAQEVFLRVWKQAAKWQPGAAKFETWMHRVAINLCYDRLRKKREVLSDEVPELADEAANPAEALQAKQLGLRIDEALQRLPDRQRLAITLCHITELTNIEAAAAMEISVDALESLLARGRRKLKEYLRSEMNDLMGAGR